MTSGTCAITLTIYADPDTVHEYFSAVYAVTKQFNARYHWGKHFTANRSVIEDLYPKFKQFAAIRKKYDPKGVFINEFIDETFAFSDKDWTLKILSKLEIAFLDSVDPIVQGSLFELVSSG